MVTPDRHLPMALWPGSPEPAAHVHTHVIQQQGDQPIAVHVTRYPHELPDELSGWAWPDGFDVHRMGIAPASRSELERLLPPSWSAVERVRHLDRARDLEALASQGSVLIGRAGDSPPLLALDALRTRFPLADVVGVAIDKRSVMVALRTARDKSAGYIVTMTAEGAPGPLFLYPSALWGWAFWWVTQAQALQDDRGEPVTLERLPPPPLQLDIVEAWRPFRVRLEGHDHITWP